MSARLVGAALVAAGFAAASPAALAAVTPGWECIPSTANQPVVSGGTGAAPSCGAGTTAVLAPTYISSGVGGKPTVQFAAVNVQIVNGSGTTSSNNGDGNVVIGYDEGARSQTGSHNLVTGTNQSYTNYGNVLAGSFNTASGVFGIVAGASNRVLGGNATVIGGDDNAVNTSYGAILGGCDNLVAGTSSTPAPPSFCSDQTRAGQFATIAGGSGNESTAVSSATGGGQLNVALAPFVSIAGGKNESLAVANDTRAGNTTFAP